MLKPIDHDLERRVQEIGRDLITEIAERRRAAGPIDRGLDRMLSRGMADEALRVALLRFIDVLPVLDEHRDLTGHLGEYLGPLDLPLVRAFRLAVSPRRGDRAQALVAGGVRQAMTWIARRFLGGSTAEEALASAAQLWNQGIACSLDRVGEAVLSEVEAEDYQRRYLDLLGQAATLVSGWPVRPLLERGHGRDLPRLNVSIKLSSLDPRISALAPEVSAARIGERLRPILLAARRNGSAVSIDMEQYALKETVLCAFKQLLVTPELRDWPDAGIALQAYLRDTQADLQDLITWAEGRGTPITVRLVRGAYWDYESVIAAQNGWPVPVWSEKWQTDQCYEHCLRLLLAHCPTIETAVATHNLRSMAFAMACAEAQGLTPDRIEFQMLYGMADAYAEVPPARGYRLRMYVPFGDWLPGMAYLVRRLLENASSQSFQRMALASTLMPDALLAVPQGREVRDSIQQPGPPAGGIRPSERWAELPAFRNEPLHRFTDPRERSAFCAALDKARVELGIDGTRRGHEEHPCLDAPPCRDYPLLIDGKAVFTADWIVSVYPADPRRVIG
ncbi:MAG: proline dehydrogenase family protein, partial [Gammaproteobacteria bacterium]